MRHRHALPLAAWVLAFAAAGPAAPHGDRKDELLELERCIAAEPRSASLRLERAWLHRATGRWVLALRDLDRAEALGGRELAGLELCRGLALLDAGWGEAAEACLSNHLERAPDDVIALKARSEARERTGDFAGVAADCARLIERLEAPEPEMWVRRARALATLGPTGTRDALRCLDHGIERLGPVVSFTDLAIELEMSRGDVDAALERLAAAHPDAARNEQVLARRGALLDRAGRAREARDAFQDALDAWSRAPARRRTSRAGLELHERLVERLRARPTPSTPPSTRRESE